MRVHARWGCACRCTFPSPVDRRGLLTRPSLPTRTQTNGQDGGRRNSRSAERDEWLDTAAALLRSTEGVGAGVTAATTAATTPRKGVGATAGDLVALQQQRQQQSRGHSGDGTGPSTQNAGGAPQERPAVGGRSNRDSGRAGNRAWYNARVRGMDADPEEHTFVGERRSAFTGHEADDEDEDGAYVDDGEEQPYERDARLAAETRASMAAQRNSDARKAKAAARRRAAGEPDGGIVDDDDDDDDDDVGDESAALGPALLEADILQRMNFDMAQLNSYLESKGRHEGDMPLHIAAQEGHVEVAYWLLMEGADCNVANQFGDSPLHHAARWGHLEVTRLLLKGGAPVDARNSLGWTPLLSAVAYSAPVEVADALLEAGADVAAGDSWGRCPIHFAASNGNARAVAALMSRGAAVDSVTNEGDTPLHYAVGYGHDHVVALLLRNGANVRRRKRGGTTALHFAAAEGHEQCMQLLLEDGADAEARDDTGVTPLHLAATGEHTHSALLLMDAGADANAADEAGVTPLDLVPYEKEVLYHVLVEGTLPSDMEDEEEEEEVLRLTQEPHREALELGWSGQGENGAEPRLALTNEPHREAYDVGFYDDGRGAAAELEEEQHLIAYAAQLEAGQRRTSTSSALEEKWQMMGDEGALAHAKAPSAAAATAVGARRAVPSGGDGPAQQMEADLRALGFSAAEVASYMATLSMSDA